MVRGVSNSGCRPSARLGQQRGNLRLVRVVLDECRQMCPRVGEQLFLDEGDRGRGALDIDDDGARFSNSTWGLSLLIYLVSRNGRRISSNPSNGVLCHESRWPRLPLDRAPRWTAHVTVLDQTALPHRFTFRDLASEDEVADAIRTMVVRGAPLIGVTGAYGLASRSITMLPMLGLLVRTNACWRRGRRW